MTSLDDEVERSRPPIERRDRAMMELDDWFARMLRLADTLEATGGIAIETHEAILADLQLVYDTKQREIEDSIHAD